MPYGRESLEHEQPDIYYRNSEHAPYGSFIDWNEYGHCSKFHIYQKDGWHNACTGCLYKDGSLEITLYKENSNVRCYSNRFQLCSPEDAAMLASTLWYAVEKAPGATISQDTIMKIVFSIASITAGQTAGTDEMRGETPRFVLGRSAPERKRM